MMEKEWGSVGGKAKQVYVERRRKQEEKWERKRRYGNKGESSISKKIPEDWGKHSNQKTFKNLCGDISIPTLNEPNIFPHPFLLKAFKKIVTELGDVNI